MNEPKSAPPPLAMNRLAVNLGAKGLSEAFARLVRFLLAVVAARWLGTDLYGEFIFAFTLTFVLAQLSDFGLPTYLCREVARSPGQAGRIFGEVVGKKLVLTLLAAVAGVGAGFLFGQSAAERQVFWLLTLSMLTATLSEIASYLFRGFHRQTYEAVVNAVQAALSVVLGLGALATGLGPRGLAAALATGALASFLLAAILVAKLLPPRGWLPYLARSTGMASWRGLAPLAVIVHIGYLPHAIDLALLRHFHDGDAVSYLNVATKLLNGATMLPMVVMSVVFPAFTSLAESESRARRRVARTTLMVIGGVALVVGACFAGGAELFLELIFGSEYLPAAPALRILGLALVALMPAIAMRELLISLGWQSAVCLLYLATVGLHIFATWILVPYGAAMGAAQAKLMAEVVAAGLLTIFLVRAMKTQPSRAS